MRGNGYRDVLPKYRMDGDGRAGRRAVAGGRHGYPPACTGAGGRGRHRNGVARATRGSAGQVPSVADVAAGGDRGAGHYQVLVDGCGCDRYGHRGRFVRDGIPGVTGVIGEGRIERCRDDGRWRIDHPPAVGADLPRPESGWVRPMTLSGKVGRYSVKRV